VDSGETHYADPVTQIWNFDGGGSPIYDPDKVIFLVAVLESDDDYGIKANDVRNAVDQDLLARLLAYKAGGLSRADIVKRLLRDMDAVIDRARGADDVIGWSQELRLTMTDLLQARRGWPYVEKTLSHKKGDASYSTTYVLQTSNIIIF
jgi:hypothetical protein